MNEHNFISSPLNYTGGKTKLLPQIIPLFPNEINTFVDLFCGGCNVGINIQAKRHIYNDINSFIIDFYNFLLSVNKKEFIKYAGMICYIKHRCEEIYNRLRKIVKEALELI